MSDKLYEEMAAICRPKPPKPKFRYELEVLTSQIIYVDADSLAEAKEIAWVDSPSACQIEIADVTKIDYPEEA